MVGKASFGTITNGTTSYVNRAILQHFVIDTIGEEDKNGVGVTNFKDGIFVIEAEPLTSFLVTDGELIGTTPPLVEGKDDDPLEKRELRLMR